MKTTHRVTTIREIDAAPNLENTVRNDKHWLLLDLMDHGYAVYETETDADGNQRSWRVKIGEKER